MGSNHADNSQYAAYLSATVTFLVFLATTIIKAFADRKAEEAAQWKRLNEIAQMLYDPETGHWGQLMAVRELHILNRVQPEARSLARSAANYFRTKESTEKLSQLVDELYDYLASPMDRRRARPMTRS